MSPMTVPRLYRTCTSSVPMAPHVPPWLGEPTCKGAHPAWYPPVARDQRVTGLRVRNTLTGEKELFVPKEGNRVMWYTCGPTVYDSCHMGHARAYLTMDIMRRILEDYFHYEVFLQVNVTDIDDKIIKRARQNKLLADYVAEALPAERVFADVREAVEKLGVKMAAKLQELQTPKADKREEDERAELLEQHRQKMAKFEETKAAVEGMIGAGNASQPLVGLAAEPLAEALDAEKGAAITQQEIFNQHGRKYELEFIQDMEALSVRLPDALTRVTEYVPQIVSFVEDIVAKGLAYESNGSVYMDITAFRAAGHAYPKLDPSKAKATAAEMAESEGTHKAASGEKRDASDFALWKKSKGGEPSWESPWGAGRPGWHIECSVMASDLLGSSMDVHAGGRDLKFPHHDNELCQSEAHHGCAQWVNYFWHFGHLHIKGLKMSKSLKNFITIREALERDSARQIRLMFLLQAWDKPMDYSDQTIDDAKAKEKRLESFFGMVKAVLRDAWLSKPTSWTPLERALSERLLVLQAETHGCLTDNFDTAGAMASLLSITDEAFTYKMKVEKEGRSPDALLLKRAAMYVTKLLRIFGVATQDDFGFPLSAGGGSYEADVAPFVETIVRFRDEVRTHAKASTPPQSSLLAMCDHLRDYKMVDLGVKVMDGDGAGAWELADASKLRKERELKEQEQADRAAEKVGNKLAVKLEEYSKAVVASMPPAQMVRQPQFATQYGGFDAQGKPTTDASGEALSKAAAKNLDKLWQKQQKEHEKYLESLKKTPELLSNLKTELEARRVEAEKLVGKDSVLSDQMRDKLKLTLDKVASSVPVDME
ncbi:hypothetical protein AB1Y20_019491 [Prymnesium parvum]|uniref:cysteine--tRNA ligase n=1 Tax=Prymnesium parvum TaxID=97485 RepID=A0AB34JUA8_PRYPA